MPRFSPDFDEIDRQRRLQQFLAARVDVTLKNGDHFAGRVVGIAAGGSADEVPGGRTLWSCCRSMTIVSDDGADAVLDLLDVASIRAVER